MTKQEITRTICSLMTSKDKIKFLGTLPNSTDNKYKRTWGPLLKQFFIDLGDDPFEASMMLDNVFRKSIKWKMSGKCHTITCVLIHIATKRGQRSEGFEAVQSLPFDSVNGVKFGDWD